MAGGTLIVDYDDRIAGLIPDAAVTHEGSLEVPHNFQATKLLRSLGIEAPAPILTQYGWADNTPFDVQKKTAAMLTTERRAYVFNGLGTGKTFTAIGAFDFLRQEGLARRMLVVAPLSTLEFVWEAEVFKRFPHLTTSVLYAPNKAKRLKKLAVEADVYVINFDGIKTIGAELAARADIDVLCIDEISKAYRNGSSERTKQMRKFAQRFSWVWGMTGSPMPRHVTDIWGQASIITPNTVPKYFKHLEQDLCYKAGPFEWKPKTGAIERAMQMLQPSTRFELSDVLELPEQVIRYVDVPLGPKQQAAYDAMKNAALACIGNHTIDAQNAGAAMSKMLQIALGWVYTHDGRVVELDNDLRLQTVIDKIDDAAQKVLVFVPFKSALAALGKRFEKEGLDYALVSGDTPAGKRSAIFSDFQNTDRYKVLGAHPDCMAHGLTLTRADTIIWGAPVTNLETFMQANGRITRIGQKHKQLVLMVGGSPIERKIYKALGDKENVQNRLLELLAEAT